MAGDLGWVAFFSPGVVGFLPVFLGSGFWILALGSGTGPPGLVNFIGLDGSYYVPFWWDGTPIC